MSTNSLDNLAANGIIEFDADSYVKGKPPRYVGDPNGYVGLPFERPLPACNEYGIMPGPKLHGEPSADAFISREHGEKPSNWKGFLFGAFIATLGALGLYKFGEKLKGWFSKKPTITQNPPGTNTTQQVSNAAQSAANTTKKSFVQNVKDGFKDLKVKFSNLKPWAKGTTYAAGGLAGLYIIYKIFGGGRHEAGPGSSHHE